METLSAAADKASGIPAHLPNCLLLKDAVLQAQEWLQEAKELQVGSTFHSCPLFTVDMLHKPF